MELCKRGRFECELGTLLIKRFGEQLSIVFQHYETTRDVHDNCQLLSQNKVKYCRSMNNSAVADEIASLAKEVLYTRPNQYISCVYVIYTWS